VPKAPYDVRARAELWQVVVGGRDDVLEILRVFVRALTLQEVGDAVGRVDADFGVGACDLCKMLFSVRA
jgi:hypothetical protein